MDELARHKGIEHIKTIEELACDGVFDTDEEVEEFLAFVTEQLPHVWYTSCRLPR